MARYEYILVSVDMLLTNNFEGYKLKTLVCNGKVLVEIQKGMYDLPQSGRIVHDKLVTKLATNEYIPADITPDFFKHHTKLVSFCLVIDNFGVKYVN